MSINFKFASLVGIPIDIANYSVGLKFFAITAGMKIYNSKIKKKRKEHEKIVLLAKICIVLLAKLYSIEFSISRALIDSFISHGGFCFGKYFVKKIWWSERSNHKSKSLNSSSKMLICLLSYSLKCRKKT